MYKCNSELVPNVLKLMFVAKKSVHDHNTKQRHCIYTFRGNNEFTFAVLLYVMLYYCILIIIAICRIIIFYFCYYGT